MINVAMSDEPPDEMNGSGLPTTGNQPMTMAMLRNAWNTIMMVQPPATMVPKLSGAVRAMRMPAHSTSRNSAITASAPTSPSSSPMMAKMKSVSDCVRYRYFSCELPSPTPKSPPPASA